MSSVSRLTHTKRMIRDRFVQEKTIQKGHLCLFSFDFICVTTTRHYQGNCAWFKITFITVKKLPSSRSNNIQIKCLTELTNVNNLVLIRDTSLFSIDDKTSYSFNTMIHYQILSKNKIDIGEYSLPIIWSLIWWNERILCFVPKFNYVLKHFCYLYISLWLSALSVKVHPVLSKFVWN